MAEHRSIEHDFDETPNMYPDLNQQQWLRLNKVNETIDSFVVEIRGKELMSKRLGKLIASFDYFDKPITILSVTTSSISIASFATVIGTPVGMVSTSFSLAFSISTGIIKKLLKTTSNKKKTTNKSVMLARCKINSIESKISEALMNNEISHEDFMVIINKSRIQRKH